MKKIMFLFLISILNGCELIETRPSIDGYVYSSTNNIPIKGALIGKINYYDNSIIVETETDSVGYFKLPPIKKKVLFFSMIDKTHFQFDIYKKQYCMKFINFGNVQQVQYEDKIFIDTIYLNPCLDTLDLYITKNR